MQFLQRILPPLLVLGAVGFVLATFFSDHKSDYGAVTLPQGGVVTLPEGESTIYAGSIEITVGTPAQIAGSSAFTIAPVGGGEPARLAPPGGDDSSISESTEALANRGAVADVHAPRAGDYQVSGGVGNIASIEFTFGRSSFAAVLDTWILWGGLILAAIVISLLPRARHRPTGEGWQREGLDDASDSPHHPAGGEGPPAMPQRPFSPYNG